MSNLVKRFRPKATEGNETFDKLYEVESEEADKLDSTIRTVFNNNFIISSDLKGVRKYEKIYNIKANSDLDLEERRKIILDKILYRPPFTRQRFRQMLENLWGKGNCSFSIDYNSFIVFLEVDTDEPENYIRFKEQVRKIIPANMYLGFSIQYTYLYLHKEFTYNKLNESGLTYYDLSQYSWDNTPYTNYYLNQNMTHSQMSDLTHAELHR